MNTVSEYRSCPAHGMEICPECHCKFCKNVRPERTSPAIAFGDVRAHDSRLGTCTMAGGAGGHGESKVILGEYRLVFAAFDV